jgi:hypothetical protein
MEYNSNEQSALSIDSSGKLVEVMEINGLELVSTLNFLTEYKIENVWKREEDKVTFDYNSKYECSKLGW